MNSKREILRALAHAQGDLKRTDLALRLLGFICTTPEHEDCNILRYEFFDPLTKRAVLSVILKVAGRNTVIPFIGAGGEAQTKILENHPVLLLKTG